MSDSGDDVKVEEAEAPAEAPAELAEEAEAPAEAPAELAEEAEPAPLVSPAPNTQKKRKAVNSRQGSQKAAHTGRDPAGFIGCAAS